MKFTFKQYNDILNLTEDQVTEEKLTEIFGAFFGGKTQPNKDKAVADLKAKKASLQTSIQQKTGALTKNKQALDKNAEWMKWIHDENSKKTGLGNQKRIDKLPSSQQSASMSRAAERDWVKSLTNEAAAITYKGYKIAKKERGMYHVTKGTTFVGHGKDHQSAMKVADKHMAGESVNEV